MSESNFNKLTALGIPLKPGMRGQVKTICPKCSHTRKPENRNEACLSVNIDEGVYVCKNVGGCDFRGSVNSSSGKKRYVKPVWNNITKLTDSHVAYWGKRGISQKTLQKLRMSEGAKWMPYPGYEIWTMQFPYIRSGEVVNVKYRGFVDSGQRNDDGSIIFKKSFRLEKDAELIFFNLDSIRQSQECLIVEGEPDCMSFIEAGYEPVVSVPNGAVDSKQNNNLIYLDNCIDDFENKTKIYIGTDNDEPGRALQAELIRRLGAERCWTLNYGDCKDGNEYMLKYGQIALLMLIDTARPAEISGIVDVEDSWKGVLDIWENGLQPGQQVGIREIDEHISFPPGFMTIVTGKSNGGKSPYIRYLLVRLACTYGVRIGLFSPEDEPISLHITNIISLITGKSFEKKYGESNRITLEEIQEAKEFIKDHFYFIGKGKATNKGEFTLKNFTVTEILTLAKKLVFRYGINYLVIDPWNKIKHANKGDNWDQKDYISNQLDLILDFSEITGVHTFLVAHPTKVEKDRKTGKYPVVTLGNISGAAEFESKPQMGMSFFRDYEKNISSMYVLKMKHKHIGKIGKVDFVYDVISGRYNVYGSPADRTNWLRMKPGQQGYNEPASILVSAPVITAEAGQTPDDIPF